MPLKLHVSLHQSKVALLSISKALRLCVRHQSFLLRCRSRISIIRLKQRHNRKDPSNFEAAIVVGALFLPTIVAYSGQVQEHDA